MKTTGTEKGCVVMMMFVLLHTSEGSTFIETLPENSSFPGYCFSSLIQNTLAVGESWSDNQECVKYTCVRNAHGTGDPYYIRGETCGAVGTAPPCVVRPGRQGMQYPQCCPYVECPNNSDNEVQFIP